MYERETARLVVMEAAIPECVLSGVEVGRRGGALSLSLSHWPSLASNGAYCMCLSFHYHPSIQPVYVNLLCGTVKEAAHKERDGNRQLFSFT